MSIPNAAIRAGDGGSIESFQGSVLDRSGSYSDAGSGVHTPQILSPASSTPTVHRTRTNVSELSRILSGIRDDRQQDIEASHEYRESAQADEIFLSQLELASRHPTKRDDVEAQATAEKNDLVATNTGDDLSEPEEKSDGQIDTGFAWVIAICGMLAVFSTWGSNSGYGVFLNFYLEHNSFNGSPYDFALIGGIVVCLAQALAPLSVFAYKIFGFKTVVGAGIVIQTAGYILASFATKLWQLYLTQGVLIGISFTLVFLPATLVIPTWFDKRKSTAMGITVSGSGLGGVVIALSVNKVVEMTGNQKWALRMCGFICLFTSAIVWIVMKPRNHKQLPLSTTLSKEYLLDTSKTIFDFTVLRKYEVSVLTAWYGIILLGYILVLFSIASYATSVGLSSQQGSVLTSVLSAAQVVGRPLIGLTADYWGRNNMAFVYSFTIMVLLFAYWINATSYGPLIGLSILLGLIVGVGSSLGQSIVIDLLEEEPEKSPAAWTAMNISAGLLALVAEVIALALVRKNSSRPYLHTQIFGGCCFAASSILSLVTREWLVRRVLKRRLKQAQWAVQKIEKKSAGYLRTDDFNETDQEEEDENHEDTLEDSTVLGERVERYQHLLRPNFIALIIRTFYPIRV